MCETGSTEGLSREGLHRACERLVRSPKEVIEKKWAQEVLQKHLEGDDSLEEDSELSYFEFLNVMLGRKRFKVSLWMYDVSDGRAARWSQCLLCHSMQGIWHTGIIVEWSGGLEESSEFWYGGKIFESRPGTTPFGTPLEKRLLGYSYKPRDEVWDYINRTLNQEFTRDKYDVLRHNCNNFTDRLSMFLLNEHIPLDVLDQPKFVMRRPLVRAVRPCLNHWLGGFEEAKDRSSANQASLRSDNGVVPRNVRRLDRRNTLARRATDGGTKAHRMWDTLGPGALVEFSKEALGRPLVGEVPLLREQSCTVRWLDFLRLEVVERKVERKLVSSVLRPCAIDMMGVRGRPSFQEIRASCRDCTCFTLARPWCVPRHRT